MSSYISSNENRFYVQLETAYSVIPAITAANRIPAVKLSAKQTRNKLARRDKTGTRTYTGLPTGVRSSTNFRLRTYLTGWSGDEVDPCYAPMFTSAMGAQGQRHPGGLLSSVAGRSVTFQEAHGLEVGQAISVASELRFVTAIEDDLSVYVNAPLTGELGSEGVASPTITYRLASRPVSAAIFDYWSPDEAVHRILRGAVANEMKIKVNGDIHEFEFAGPAADIADSSSARSEGVDTEGFPPEPAISPFDYTIVPGHLGQAWIGGGDRGVFTLTDAEISLDNSVALNSDEFGSTLATGYTAGAREVNVSFSLYEAVDEGTAEIYQAARDRSPIQVMFQLGQTRGQMFGAYLKSVVPVVPEFEDAGARLRWEFAKCRAEGTDNDELIIAFA